MRALTWNLERKKPTSPTGRAGVRRLFEQDPDVMVLTEARTGFPAEEGHLVWSQPLPVSHVEDDERRVVMWSRNPWTDVDDVGHPGLPTGRFVRGVTETDFGPVTIVGVCIPWHMSNVSVGTKDRRPWEDHLRYLAVLPDVLGTIDGPVVVAGDFNQRIPRADGRKDVGKAMTVCFEGFEIPTAGLIDGCDRALIDHVAIRGCHASKTWAWPATQDGVRMSDHDGAGVDVELGKTG